ncbi:MAG: hypothetical protein M1812_008170, partial [Candelaria pacifica]
KSDRQIQADTTSESDEQAGSDIERNSADTEADSADTANKRVTGSTAENTEEVISDLPKSAALNENMTQFI